MKNVLPLLLCCSSALAATTTHAVAAEDTLAKPNIVVIFIDDLGYGDIGPYGATKQKTPNLDRMAEEGMKLTSFYAAPVCSVSRAQMMTGCYGARVSVPGVYFPGQANGLNPAEHTIAERLKEQGYATVCIGKWHLGDQPEFLPTRQGFDHYFGIPYSNDMQRKAVQGAERVVPLLRDEKVAELLSDEEQSRIVERYTDEAVKFIRERKDEPFFLYFPHTAVHTPIFPGKAFRRKSANGRFGDWVEEVDWSVGRVLQTLDELSLTEKTLVIFTTDNGPWLVKGADGGSAGPLRGGKGSTWEGGMRVPTIARWPGKIKAGSVCDSVAGTIDILPTVVALAGGTVPDEPTIDGRDISPLLLGKSKQSPREAHYYFAGYSLQAVRQGAWKLAIAAQPERSGAEPNDNSTNKVPRLYNLDREIGERTDLADQHPEIVARLKVLASRMQAELGGQSPTARRPAGVVSNPKTLYPTDPAEGGRRAAASTQPTTPADLSKLKPGDSVASSAAPRVGNRPFTVSCIVKCDQSDTVVIAQGGLTAGYAIYFKDNQVVFAVRTGGKAALTEIAARKSSAPRSSAPRSSGPVRLVASLAADGAMSLSVDGDRPVTGKSPRLIPRQPAEDFCLGHDNGKPVVAHASGARFTGTVTELKITSP